MACCIHAGEADHRLKTVPSSPRSSNRVHDASFIRSTQDGLAGRIQLKVKTDSAEVQLRHFEPGQQVVVTDGPFVGVEAIYQMADAEGRVMVLLNILSKQVKMAVPPASIRKAN